MTTARVDQHAICPKCGNYEAFPGGTTRIIDEHHVERRSEWCNAPVIFNNRPTDSDHPDFGYVY